MHRSHSLRSPLAKGRSEYWDWIENHPNAKSLDKITMESEMYCGGLMVETSDECLPSGV